MSEPFNLVICLQCLYTSAMFSFLAVHIVGGHVGYQLIEPSPKGPSQSLEGLGIKTYVSVPNLFTAFYLFKI